MVYSVCWRFPAFLSDGGGKRTGMPLSRDKRSPPCDQRCSRRMAPLFAKTTSKARCWRDAPHAPSRHTESQPPWISRGSPVAAPASHFKAGGAYRLAQTTAPIVAQRRT